MFLSKSCHFQHHFPYNIALVFATSDLRLERRQLLSHFILQGRRERRRLPRVGGRERWNDGKLAFASSSYGAKTVSDATIRLATWKASKNKWTTRKRASSHKNMFVEFECKKRLLNQMRSPDYMGKAVDDLESRVALSACSDWRSHSPSLRTPPIPDTFLSRS